MRRSGWWWVSGGLCFAVAGCGGSAQRGPEAPQGAQELSFEADTVHPGDTDAAEAPESTETAAGTALANAVRHAVDARHGAIAQCYAAALRRAPDAVGRFAVELTWGTAGRVERVAARTEGEGGLSTARTCVEDALRSITVAQAPAALRVRRSYTFANPPVDLDVAAPLAVSLPAHGAGHGHGATATATAGASASPAASSTPPESVVGPLTAVEVSGVLTAHVADLQACYGASPRATRQATGAATAHFTVGGDGVVGTATFESEVARLVPLVACVTSALHAVRFRASGTQTNATAHVMFGAAP